MRSLFKNILNKIWPFNRITYLENEVRFWKTRCIDYSGMVNSYKTLVSIIQYNEAENKRLGRIKPVMVTIDKNDEIKLITDKAKAQNEKNNTKK